MRNIAFISKYYGFNYYEILELPYTVFLGYLKYARVFELEKTEEGRDMLEMGQLMQEEEPDLQSLRNLKI